MHDGPPSPDAGGTIRLDGAAISERDVDAQRIELRPRSRSRRTASATGLVPMLSVASNLTLASLKRFLRAFVIDGGRERSAASEMHSRRCRSRSPDPTLEVASLSRRQPAEGRHRQGAADRPARCCSCDEPTRGIDVGAKAEVFRTMRRLADDGLGVLFVTSDLKEVMALADRILGDVARAHHRRLQSAAEATEALVVAASTAAMQRGGRIEPGMTA